MQRALINTLRKLTTSPRPVVWRAIAVVCLMTVISCSASTGNTAKTLAIPEINEVEIVGSNLYRVTKPESEAFFTLIEECDEKDSTISALARARQLFIGLEGLKISGKAGFDLSGKFVSAVAAHAEVEGSSLSVNSYSLREETCFYDLVFWKLEPIGDQSSKVTDPLRYAEIAKAILPSVISD